MLPGTNGSVELGAFGGRLKQHAHSRKCRYSRSRRLRFFTGGVTATFGPYLSSIACSQDTPIVRLTTHWPDRCEKVDRLLLSAASPTRDCLLRLPRWLRALAIVLFALMSCSASAHCEVSVQGTADAVRVETSQAPLSMVLRALGTNFKVRHDALISLDAVIISGTYSGALDEVLRRVLTGLNYVIKTEDGTVEVFIVGRSGDAPTAVATTPPAPPTNTNPAVQWRGLVPQAARMGRSGDAPTAVATTPPALPPNTNPAVQWRRLVPQAAPVGRSGDAPTAVATTPPALPTNTNHGVQWRGLVPPAAPKP
jgi:hypothetical protein